MFINNSRTFNPCQNRKYLRHLWFRRFQGRGCLEGRVFFVQLVPMYLSLFPVLPLFRPTTPPLTGPTSTPTVPSLPLPVVLLHRTHSELHLFFGQAVYRPSRSDSLRFSFSGLRPPRPHEQTLCLSSVTPVLKFTPFALRLLQSVPGPSVTPRHVRTVLAPGVRVPFPSTTFRDLTLTVLV